MRFKLSTKNIALILWAILISNRAFLTRPQSVNFQTGLELHGEIMTEILVTVFVFIASCLLLLHFFVRSHRFILPMSSLPLWFYLFMVLFSLLWTPNPLYAGFWALRLSSAIILLTLYFRQSAASATHHEIKRFLSVTVISLIPYMFLPFFYLLKNEFVTLRVDKRIAAFGLHPGLGSIIAFGIALICFLQAIQGSSSKNKTCLILGGVAITSGMLFGGKSGAVAFLLSMALFVITRLSLSKVFRFGILALLIGGILLIFTSYLPALGLIAHLKYYSKTENLLTLTGRVSLWQSAINVWTSSFFSFFLGNGYTSSRINLIPTIWGSTTHAHNSFLESLLEVGLIGSLPLYYFILRTFVVAVRVIRRKEYRDTTVVSWSFVILYLLLTSTVDNVFGGLIYAPFYLLIAGAMGVQHLYKPLPKLKRGNF